MPFRVLAPLVIGLGLGAAFLAATPTGRSLSNRLVGGGAAAEDAVPPLGLAVFPGAEGFGTDTPAGRGGPVCRVNSLADAGAGTLRSCIERGGPRSVVFEVGGTIALKQPLVVNEPFLSVYGQSAPGDGILLIASPDYEEAVLSIATHDVLVQHLRVRSGASRAPSCCRDAISIASKVPGRTHHVVLDHVSMSWGTDEVMDIWYDAHDITISRSIVAEGLNRSTNDKGPAGRGLIVGGPAAGSITLHHNLLAHNLQRNPLIKAAGVTDVVSNLVFHWVERAAQVEATDDGPTVRVNFIDNLFVPGATTEARQRTRVEWGTIAAVGPPDRLSIYLEGNVGPGVEGGEPQSALLSTGRYEGYDPSLGWIAGRPHPAPAVSRTSPTRLRAALTADVGATLPRRDATDRRLLDDLASGGGRMPDCVGPEDPPSREVCAANHVPGGWPRPATAEMGPERDDADGDGVPDAWELAEGLDPSDPADAVRTGPTGYTALERWVHSLGERR